MSSSILFANQYGQVDKTTLGQSVRGLLIEHQYCHAKISLYGGQVLTWQPEEHKPVFWLSENTHFCADKAIRGGVPLCWPWFGPYKDGGNHGFARLQVWQLDSIDMNEDAVTIVISWQGGNIHPLWPTASELRQELVFGKEFKQTLYMKNTGKFDVEYSGALHSYFCVSQPENVLVNDLNQAIFDDKLTGKKAEPETLKHCKGPIDRVYHHNKPLQLVDKDWQRTIEVIPQNTRQWILWNPGADIAKKMPDIHPNGENEFVCLEAGNTVSQTLAVNRWVSIGQTIRVIGH